MDDIVAANVFTRRLPRCILLQAPGFLGDEVVFTGVIRELAISTGWNIRVNTAREALWHHNKSIQGIGANGSEDLILEKDYCPPYHQMGQVPVHYLEQYLRNIRRALGLTEPYQVSKFSGHVVLNGKEMRMRPFGLPSRYWVIVDGWKPGVPAKAWPTPFYQEVVDALRGRILFVQAGSRESWHPPLNNVVNLVGKTPLRELIQLIYHSEGVVCPITSIMHLAAAIPANPASGFAVRPCVVIGGGRESPHYINYPMHKVISTVGQLNCCASSACGKTHFGPGHCPSPVPVAAEVVPKCMTLIRPTDVVSAIEFYYRGRVLLPPRLGRIEVFFRHLQSLRAISADGQIKGIVAGDLRGKISSQMLRGDDRIKLVCIPALTDDNDANAGRKDDAAFIEARTYARVETEFARSRCNLIAPNRQREALSKASEFDFAFIELQNSPAVSGEVLQQLVGKIRPGGFVLGTCRNNEQINSAIHQFAASSGLVLKAEKDNCWLIQLQPEKSDSHVEQSSEIP